MSAGTVIIALGDRAVAVGALALVLALHGAALLAITAGVQALLGRAGQRWSWREQPALLAALWTVAIIKFVLPVGPALPWSLSDLLAALPRVFVDGAAVAPVASTASLPAVAGVAPVGPAVVEPTAVAVAVLALVALAGWAVIAVRRLYRLGRHHAAAVATARALPAASPQVVALVGELAARLGVRAPHVVVAAGGSPYVVGLRRPVVVLPQPLLGGPSSLTQAAIAHELAHVRRRDGMVQLVVAVIEAALWWCPLIPLARRQLERARESACDAVAVTMTGVDVAGYARLLVRQARVAGAGPIAAHLGAGPRMLDARLRGLFGGGGPAAPRLGKLGVIALVPWTALALGGARAADAAPPVVDDVCIYTPAMAESLLAAFPQADGDGDGELSRVEACDLQAELRRQELMASAGLAGPPSTTPAIAAPADDLVSLADETAAPSPTVAALDLRAARELLDETTSCCKCSADESNSAASMSLRSAGSPACSTSLSETR